jgi:hypothetical protein
MDVMEKITLGAYSPSILYPTKPRRPVLSNGRATAAEVQVYADNMRIYEADFETFKTRQETYNSETKKLVEQFRKDLAEEFDLTSHPKEGKLFEMAWARSHGEGFASVYHTYSDLTELLN